MSVAHVAHAQGWRKHLADYWLIAAAVVAMIASGVLLLGVLPIP